MKQRDAGSKSRFDAAKNLLLESGAVAANGVAADPRLRLFEFSDDARPVPRSVLDLAPAGKTTRFHKSVGTMLSAPANDEAVNAVILLTDGHDFELVNPVKTGLLARNRQAPIYAVRLGPAGQGARRGRSHHGLSALLLRQTKSAHQRHAAAGRMRVGRPDRAVAAAGASRRRPNTSTRSSFRSCRWNLRSPNRQPASMNTKCACCRWRTKWTRPTTAPSPISMSLTSKSACLLLEGDPYWDTTFLQRSLMRNDKFDVDALIRYGAEPRPGDSQNARRRRTARAANPGSICRLRCHHSRPRGGFAARIASAAPRPGRRLPPRSRLLDQYVNERGGTVIFSRGRAFTNASAGELEPVLWGGKARERVHLDVTAEGRALSPFRVLNDGAGGLEALPDLLDGKTPQETKPLASTFAVATGRDDATAQAAIIHRRYGRGQVVSIGVAGLWRWALESKVEGVNSPFDRFWDQMVLWLLAGRDFIPSRQFSFRPNSANILLGEKVYFHLVLRQPDPKLMSVPVTIHYGEAEAGRVNLTPVASAAGRLSAEFLPERAGRYRATVNLPDGTTQESRFIVFTENLEETEVATDTLYLRRLCESSGGRLIAAGEFAQVVEGIGQRKKPIRPHGPSCARCGMWLGFFIWRGYCSGWTGFCEDGGAYAEHAKHPAAPGRGRPRASKGRWAGRCCSAACNTPAPPCSRPSSSMSFFTLAPAGGSGFCWP